jgi:hypothetical protein
MSCKYRAYEIRNLEECAGCRKQEICKIVFARRFGERTENVGAGVPHSRVFVRMSKERGCEEGGL